MGDPFEISTIRREVSDKAYLYSNHLPHTPISSTPVILQDYDFVAPPSEYEDVLQANSLPSSATLRGHQFPAAFHLIASGLNKVSFALSVVCVCFKTDFHYPSIAWH